ncbi:hypothetical protein G6F35_015446 [Rhizopus arrhizus]|nr:hypothetical protein G6F35_015446 [Rhizopus arrhizus]
MRPVSPSRRYEKKRSDSDTTGARREVARGGGIVLREGVKHVLPHLEHLRADAGADPGAPAGSRGSLGAHGRQRMFQHAARQAAPAGMRRAQHLPVGIGNDHRQAVRHHDGQHAARLRRDAGVYCRFVRHVLRIGVHNLAAVHLAQPQRVGRHGGAHAAPVLGHRVRIIARATPQK